MRQRCGLIIGAFCLLAAGCGSNDLVVKKQMEMDARLEQVAQGEDGLRRLPIKLCPALLKKIFCVKCHKRVGHFYLQGVILRAYHIIDVLPVALKPFV